MSSYLSHRRKGFQGGVTAFDGFGNRSRSFDGTDDCILVSPDTAIDNLFSGGATFAAWIKTNDASLTNRIIDKRTNAGGSSGWILYVDDESGGNCDLAFWQGFSGNEYLAQTTSREITLGSWVHIAVVYDSSSTTNNATMYVDGSSVGVTELTSPSGSSSNDSSKKLSIGDIDPDFTAARRAFDGNIADVRLYDTDLTASQISDLYAGTNVTTNLVGNWLTDADNVLDNAGTNHGTNYGSKYSYDNPSPAVEFGSASRSFNGTSDYVDLGNSTDFSFSDGSQDEPFSLCAWIKCDDNGTFRVLSKDNGAASSYEWLLATDGGGNLNVYLIDGNQFRGREYTTPLPENEWIHVASTYDGSGGTNFRLGLKLYVNGVQVDNADYGSGGYVAMNPTTNNVFIGRYGTSYSDGKIADARIYDAELSSTDISDIYNGTNVTTNLIGHWLTDNDDVEDKAGTNDGTNYGSTYDYDAPFTEVTLPNHYWDLSDTGTYADSGKLASAGWDLNEYSSVNSSVQNIGTSTKTVLDTISGGVLEYKNGTNVDVGWDSESKEISMACWFYCTAVDNSGNWLISWRGQTNDNRIAQLFITNDSGLQIFRGSIFDGQGNIISTPQSGTSISLNTWHHGALTWDNTTLKTYINGELFATGTNASVDGFGTNPVDCEFAIGRGAWDKTNSGTDHTGYTFGAGVWDVALTESQIKALYNDGNALDYSETTWR